MYIKSYILYVIHPSLSMVGSKSLFNVDFAFSKSFIHFDRSGAVGNQLISCSRDVYFLLCNLPYMQAKGI